MPDVGYVVSLTIYAFSGRRNCTVTALGFLATSLSKHANHSNNPSTSFDFPFDLLVFNSFACTSLALRQ